MGLDYGFISIIRKEDKERAYAFMAANGERDENIQQETYYTLFFEVDEIITKYLQQSLGFRLPFPRPSIKEFLSADRRARVGYVWIREDIVPGHEEYIKLSFYAVTSSMSRLFCDSPSVRKWFFNFSAALQAKMTYADFETEGTEMFFWSGREINIKFAGDEYIGHSRSEFIDIMSLFAAQTDFEYKTSKTADKYSIQFVYINGRKSSTSNRSEYTILSEYLDIWRDPREVRETLLPAVDAAVAGVVEFDDIDADVVGVALIYKDRVQLCSSSLGFNDLVIPTEDFQILIREWLAFLDPAPGGSG